MVVETSRPVAHVARELNVNETTLGNWVKEYRETHADDEPALQLPERARLRELERENRELKIRLSSFQKPRRTSRRSNGNLAVRVHRCGVRHPCRGYGMRSDGHADVRLAGGIQVRFL
jgi:transposase-like protein